MQCCQISRWSETDLGPRDLCRSVSPLQASSRQPTAGPLESPAHTSVKQHVHLAVDVAPTLPLCSSHRAACYTKLGAWNEGLKDAEECIRLEPSFAKGYSRKGHLQFFMKVGHTPPAPPSFSRRWVNPPAHTLCAWWHAAGHLLLEARVSRPGCASKGGRSLSRMQCCCPAAVAAGCGSFTAGQLQACRGQACPQLAQACALCVLHDL